MDEGYLGDVAVLELEDVDEEDDEEDDDDDDDDELDDSASSPPLSAMFSASFARSGRTCRSASNHFVDILGRDFLQRAQTLKYITNVTQ